MDRKEYDQLAEELKPTGHKVKNAWNAFLYGGVLGAIAQGVLVFYMNVYDCSQKEATPMKPDYYTRFYSMLINWFRII